MGWDKESCSSEEWDGESREGEERKRTNSGREKVGSSSGLWLWWWMEGCGD